MHMNQITTYKVAKDLNLFPSFGRIKSKIRFWVDKLRSSVTFFT